MEPLKGIRIGVKSLLVQEIPNDPNELTKGGLLLTQAAAEKHNKRLKTGIVVARGPGGHEDGHFLDLDVKVGDKIIYAAPIEFLFKGNHYHLVHFASHVATLEDE